MWLRGGARYALSPHVRHVLTSVLFGLDGIRTGSLSLSLDYGSVTARDADRRIDASRWRDCHAGWSTDRRVSGRQARHWPLPQREGEASGAASPEIAVLGSDVGF